MVPPRTARGMIVINPPYAFTQALAALLDALRTVLAPPGHRSRITGDWLGG